MDNMERYEIDKLKELPINGVCSRLGIKVVRGWALCPHHADRTPSMHVDRRRNFVKCFACGYGPSDTIGITQEVLGVGFREATRWLAQEYGVIIEESRRESLGADPNDSGATTQRTYDIDREWLESLLRRPVLCEEARQFLEARRIDERVVRWLGLTSITEPTPCWRYGRPFFNAPSLLIPYRDVEGKLLTVQARRTKTPQPPEGGEKAGPEGGEGLALPRFQFPRGTKPHIYNLPILRCVGKGDELWIAEGPSDCWAMLSSGRKAVAIPSATLLSEADMRMLDGVLPRDCRLVACPDRDEAGEKLFGELTRVANTLQRTIVRHQLPEGVKDFGAWWSRQ